MGSDDLFHRRKARLSSSLVREIDKRESYDLVLIVCEGAKTEPHYLKGLKSQLRLSNANVKVLDDHHGTDPLSIIQCALKYYDADDQGYDRVYCVFDRDRHETYGAALELVRNHQLGQDGKLIAITSIPCFEIWLLLHFQYTTKGFNSTGKTSACDKLVRELKKHIRDYKKNCPNTFALVKDHTDRAIDHARRLAKHNRDVNTDNPSTKMHSLVQYLRKLKSKEILNKR